MSNSIKLCLYLKHFPPDGNNLNDGVSKAVHGFASGLVACGTNVTVLTESSSSNSSFKTAAGYTIECFANRVQRPSLIISPGLQRYIHHNSNNIDLIVLNGVFHPSVYSMSRLLKKFGVPYVVAPHESFDPAIFSSKPYLKWPYWYLLERRMQSQAKAVQVLDIRQAQRLLQLGVEAPVIEIQNGYSPAEVCPESSLHWRKEGTAKLLFFGRLDAYHKGLDLLLNAFAEVARVADTQLVIQGPDCGDRKTLEKRAARLSLSQLVTFLEPAYSNSPASIIKEYDIFCLPSRFEGFSMAAMEAMLAGRVLLVSKVAGIASHVRASGCGVLVTPEVSGIKAGLIELLHRRSEWKEMGLSGRLYALEHLQWSKIASKALERYSQCALGAGMRGEG